MRDGRSRASFGRRSSLLSMFRSAAESAQSRRSATTCARMNIAELALRGAMAAAHINECDICRAEHLAIRAALACHVTEAQDPLRAPKMRELRVIQGGLAEPSS